MRFHVLLEGSASVFRPLPLLETGGLLTSTCSDDHVSIDKDLTLDMCVPSLRWIAAHRMQRKMPI